MNHLRTQCFLGSVAFHGLLLVLLVAGSGFLVSHQEPEWESLPVLDFIPTHLVDENVVGGGDPRGTTAPPPAATQATPPPAACPTHFV